MLFSKCWWGCGENGIFVHCWWDCRLVQPQWKTVWRFLNKSKIELPYYPEISLPGIYPKKSQTLIWKGICICMLIADLFTIAKIWEQPKYPLIDEWVKKMYIYTMEYCSAVKKIKNEILQIAKAWMDLENIILSLNLVHGWTKRTVY